jgi:hypothetical protein
MLNSTFHDVTANPDAAVRQVMQKAQIQDGLPEIAIGLAFLALAGLMWLQVVFRPGSIWNMVTPLGMIFVVSPMIGASPWAIRKLRRRYLIERVGYVEPKPTNRKRLVIVLGLAFVVAVVVAYVVVRAKLLSASRILAETGIVGGALSAYAGRMIRLLIVGGIMAATGIILAFSKVSLEVGFTILYGLPGLLSLISGCVVLFLFIRNHDEAGE